MHLMFVLQIRDQPQVGQGERLFDALANFDNNDLLYTISHND